MFLIRIIILMQYDSNRFIIFDLNVMSLFVQLIK